MKNFKLHIFLIILVGVVCQCKKDKAEVPIESFKAHIEEKLQNLEGDFAYAFLNLSDTNQVITINADKRFHAASTMKTPVMIEIFKQASLGKFKMSDSILIKNEFKSIVDGSSYSMDISEDSGDKLYSFIGKKVTIYDLMYNMITVSSNLATNILIDLVDAKSVTANMRTLGANNIEVLRGVEDIKAYEKGLNNATTARDLMLIMQSIANHSAGKPKDCEQMIAILKEQHFNDMIPKYFPENIEVAHKTGSITGVHHDSGIVYLPNGSSFVLIILSKNIKDFDYITDQLAIIAKETLEFSLQ